MVAAVVYFFLNLEKKSPTDKYIISPSETNL